MDLSQNTLLQRVPDLNMHLGSGNNLRISIGDYVLEGGPHSLAVLDAFAQPRQLSEALEQLRARTSGVQDWMDLTSTIFQFYQAGVLRDETRAESLFTNDDTGYDAPPIHLAMLNDRARTARFLAGIREIVRPGDVVVDIGTGTGILAVAAAQAGARHVYAIEATSIGRSASAVFAANGLADRITLLQGWSTQVSLPERADVLISEMIGNEPLGERVLEVTADALRRLLKPDARLVPSKVTLFGLPVTIPAAELVKRTFTIETLRTWRAWYDIDFGPLAEATRNASNMFYTNPYSAREWQSIGDPVLLADIDLTAVSQLLIDTTTSFTANVSGQLNGVIVYFELELGPNTCLSTCPAQVDEDNHWRSPVWVLPDTLSAQAGDRFDIIYRYRVPGTQRQVDVVRSHAP